jgi:hypothetical protein
MTAITESLTPKNRWGLPRRFTVPVVGLTFRGPDYPKSLHLLADVLGFATKAREDDGVRPLLVPEFRRHVDEALLGEGQLPARLAREPDNPVDPLAVAVWPTTVEIGQLGYLPVKLAQTRNGPIAHLVAASMDAGTEWDAWLSRVRINWEHPDRPGIDVTLRRRD